MFEADVQLLYQKNNTKKLKKEKNIGQNTIERLKGFIRGAWEKNTGQNNVLKYNGAIGLQTITIEDKFFKKYRKFPDFYSNLYFSRWNATFN